MTVVAVRRVTRDDAAALAALDATAFDAPWDVDAVRGLLAGGLTIGWCVVETDRLAAALLLRCVAGEAEVLRLAVEPARRRRGYALALLRQALREVGRDLPHGLHLEVRASNAAALALYRGVGFRDAGRRSGYYAAPVEDAVLMRWRPGPETAARHGLHPPNPGGRVPS